MPQKAASIFYFLFISLVCHINAQEIHFINISNSLNLPSQECYNVIQDSKGYIWICTENGLVKYSKDERKVFDKLNGLDENSVYYIAENNNKEIELITSNNRLLIIKQDTIKEHPKSKKLKALIEKKLSSYSFNISYLLNRNYRGDLVVNSQQRTFLISDSLSQIVDLTKSNHFNSEAYLVIDKSNTQDYFIKNKESYLDELYKKEHIIRIDVFSGSGKKRINVQLSEHARVDWRVRICNVNGVTFLTLHDKLVRIDKDLNTDCFSFPSVITSVNLSSTHGLWVGTSSFGVYHYSDINDMSKVRTGLKGLSVSSVLVDKEGGTWCTTTEKGVYYSGNYNVLSYPYLTPLNKKTTLLKAVDHKLFISTEIDKLKILDKGQINDVTLLETGNSDITDIIQFKNETYIASKGYAGLLNNNFQFVKTISHSTLPSYDSAHPYYTTGNITAYQFDTSSAHLYVLGTSLTYKLTANRFESINIPLKSKGRCFKVCNDSILYTGCNDGLYKLNLIHNTQQKIKAINTAVSKIITGTDGTIYFTTKGQGLFKLVNDIPVKIGLGEANYILNDMVEDPGHNLWISANDGLICLKNIQMNPIIIEKYDISNGLISNNIGQLAIDDGYLYVSSPDGICRLPIYVDLINHTPPPVYINELTINGIKTNYAGQELNLKHNENTITVTLDQLTFKHGKKECILYKLNGLNADYKAANKNKIIFESLPPNNYELIIYAINSDGIKSLKPIVIKFIIHPPFWFTTWFLTGSAVLLLFLAYSITRKIITRIKKKEEEKTRINKLISESQLSALQAQMNPHFIFNAINSIQNFVLNKKEEEAYDYLTKFSKLIRMVLNNSRENVLALHAELETLNLYIELEQLRFDNSFEYRLNVSGEIDAFDIEIPTMLIQPYVENSIWHGLMNLNSERRGLLKINISTEENLLKVVIEDNGIGRVRSNEFKREAIHHSIAMKLTEERLQMINELGNTKNVKVVVNDLYDEEQKAFGTRIELFLPIIT